MSLGGSPKAPAPPDPAVTAAAQGAANRETAITQANLNLINENTPLGTRTFESFDDPRTGEPRFSSDIALTPEGQAAFDAEQAVTRGTNELAASQIGRVESAVEQPFSFAGLPDAPVAGDEARQRVEDALFQRQTRFLDPRFEQEQRDLETQLANQGIVRDSEGFRRELDNFNLRKDASFADARNAAIQAGGAEQTREFDLAGTARDRGIQERTFERNIPLNEIGALLSAGQINVPQFASPSQTAVAPTDVIGATFGAANLANQNFQAEQQRSSALNQGLFGLGSAALAASPFLFGSPVPRRVPGFPPFSDRRLKTDIIKIGVMVNGLFIYLFKYIWGGPLQVGVMSDEVRNVLPHAVYDIGGYDAVDYVEVLKHA